MSLEAWGDEPPHDDVPPCELCENELGSSKDCALCQADARVRQLDSDLLWLKHRIRHRLGILRSRTLYEGGEKANGVSVEHLMAITLVCATPGLDFVPSLPVQLVAEAEAALLTLENMRYAYPDRKPLV